MEDFPKLATLKNPSSLSNEQLKIYKEAKERLKYEEPKIGFIQTRLNRDNFWNLMFLVLSVLGFGAGFSIQQPFGGILFWVTLLGVPYLVKRNSDITFDKDKLTFFNRKQESLNDRAPNLFLLIVITVGLTAFTGLVLDNSKNIINITFARIVVGIMPIFIPTVYFVLKNCPIALLFTKEAWIGDGSTRAHRDGGYEGYKYSSTNYFSSSSSPNIVSNPSYRELSCNIFHKR